MEANTDERGVRLNRYLSEAGVCSRREADERISRGEVQIDGRTAVLGDRVLPGQDVTVSGELVSHDEPEVILLFNKPKGIVCTAEKKEKHNIIDFIDYPVRIFPVGRLDKDSRGLILLTNRGDLVNKLNRSGNYHEKEYDVKIDREVTEDFVEAMSSGVYLPELQVKTRPCRVWKTGYDRIRIVLTQGLNRQIRRMCEACGAKVRDLRRIRIMHLRDDSLPEGMYRELTPEEREQLLADLAESENAPGGAGRDLSNRQLLKRAETRKKQAGRSHGGRPYAGHSASGSHAHGSRPASDRPYSSSRSTPQNRNRQTDGDTGRYHSTNHSASDRPYSSSRSTSDRPYRKAGTGSAGNYHSSNRPAGGRSYSSTRSNSSTGKRSQYDRDRRSGNKR